VKKTTKFVWDDKDMTITQCLDCKHWVRGAVCAAFPNGIPDVILENKVSHLKPYKGDKGIQFEAL
jgi:hypothetical protein